MSYMLARTCRASARGWLLVGAVSLASCATDPELVPAPTATVVGEDTAVDAVGGVRIAVDPQSWREGPIRVSGAITPVRVVLENESGRPLRVRYSEFTLVDPGGFRRAALPPYAVGAYADRPTPLTPAFEYRSFLLAPTYAPFYPGLRPWAGPFAYDPLYYNLYYPSWPDPLPTQAMLELALPEGVLESGGRVTGYLYFQDLPDDVDRVLFRADLVDAQTGEAFGEIRIPFLADGAERVSRAAR